MKLAPLSITVALVLAACLCQQPAHGAGSREEEDPLRRQQTEQPLPGGFRDIAVDEPMVLEACEFLRKQLQGSHPEIRLGQVKGAARQIVAGTNIRLVYAYGLAGDTADRELIATVYFDLKGNRKLRSLELGSESPE